MQDMLSFHSRRIRLEQVLRTRVGQLSNITWIETEAYEYCGGQWLAILPSKDVHDSGKSLVHWIEDEELQFLGQENEALLFSIRSFSMATY